MANETLIESKAGIPQERLQLYLDKIEQNLGSIVRYTVEKSIQNGHMGEGVLSKLSGLPSYEPTLPPDVSRREKRR